MYFFDNLIYNLDFLLIYHLVLIAIVLEFLLLSVNLFQHSLYHYIYLWTFKNNIIFWSTFTCIIIVKLLKPIPSINLVISNILSLRSSSKIYFHFKISKGSFSMLDLISCFPCSSNALIYFFFELQLLLLVIKTFS